jgi:hypothetical protein
MHAADNWGGYASGTRRVAAALVCALGLALGACGDDESEEVDSGPPGERCAAPGIGDNRCFCSAEQPLGYRSCMGNRIWSECECARPGTQDTCTSGQPVRCTPCPGTSEERIVECQEDNTFDCSCPDRDRDGG